MNHTKELLFSCLKLSFPLLLVLVLGFAKTACAQDFDADISKAFEYYHNGQYSEAAELFQKWLLPVKENLGEHDTSVYEPLVNWTGLCFLYSGQYEKALPLHEEDTGICKQVYGPKSMEYVKSIHSLAGIYEVMKDYGRALPLYREAGEIYQDVVGTGHTEYADCLKDLAYCYKQLGEFTEAQPIFEEAKTIYKNTLGPKSKDYLENLYYLADLYRDMGNYSRALPLYEEKIMADKELSGEESPEYATGLIDLANIYVEIGDYDRALPLYLEALSIRKKTLGESDPDYATCLNNLAHLYQLTGDYTRSLPLYEEASRIYKYALGGDDMLYATSLNNLANIYQIRGNYDKALALYEESSDILRKTLGAGHPRYASSLNNMSVLYQEMGDYQQALALSEDALAIQKEALGPGHPDFAISLDNLALIYQEMGNYSRALPLFEEAINIRKEALGPMHPDYASSLNNLAGIYKDLGNYPRALTFFEEATRIDKEVLGTDHPNYALSLSNLSMVYEKMGDIDKAIELSEEALNIRKRVLDPMHPNLAVNLNNLGILYQETGNYSMAYALFEETNAIITGNIRDNFSFMSEMEKKNYYATVGYFFNLYLSFIQRVLVTFPECPGRGYDNELIRKGLILSSHEALQQSIQASGDTALVLRYEQLGSLKRQITSLLQQPYPETVKANISNLEQEAKSLERDLSRDSRDFSLMQQQFTVTWQDVQKGLDPGEAAIEFTSYGYFDGRRWTDSTLYCAFILRPEDTVPMVVLLGEEEQIKEALPAPGTGNIGINQAYFRNRGIGILQMDEHDYRQTASIYDLIWKPLDSLLQGTATIYYSLTGLLHTVSLAAIFCPDSTLLMDRYNLVQLSTTRILASSRMKPAINSAVVYGGIQYDLDVPELAAQAGKYDMPEDNSPAYSEFRPRGGERHGFQYLEGTEREAEIVKGEFIRDDIPVRAYSGAAALEESFLALSGSKAPSVVHISTHGFYLPDTITKEENREKMIVDAIGEQRFRLSDDPLLRSGLVMAGGNLAWRGELLPEGLEDGILTAKEVSNLNLLNTQLVVLSACQTGLGDVKGSEGVEGLLRGFKMAGVRYLVLSLWEVPDVETVEFMEHFYSNWLGGQEILTAFRTAQKQMREKYPDEPSKWAAFVLVE